jgi:hypothetical protein
MIDDVLSTISRRHLGGEPRLPSFELLRLGKICVVQERHIPENAPAFSALPEQLQKCESPRLAGLWLKLLLRPVQL